MLQWLLRGMVLQPTIDDGVFVSFELFAARRTDTKKLLDEKESFEKSINIGNHSATVMVGEREKREWRDRCSNNPTAF